MIYDVSKFEELVKKGYLRKSENENLVLYKYSEKTTHEKYWNEYTRQARGLILNKHSGYVIAKTFPKFFNVGEMPESSLKNFPECKYTIAEKVDGSLGILYYHNYKWNVASCGSLNSEQAIKGQEILKKYNTKELGPEITLLVEVIYPANKIVVNYGQEEKLVLLGAYYRDTGEELDDFRLKNVAKSTGIPLRNEYPLTITDAINLQSKLSKDEEGFVVKFENGLRIKIKGDEYLRIHKIVTNLSPLSFWEVMKDGKVPEFYIQQVPEEFKDDFKPIVNELEKQYIKIQTEIEEEFQSLPTKETTSEARKEVGLYIKRFSFNHANIMFPRLLNQTISIDYYILQQIRPKGNCLNL